jgi:ATP-dependent HslUV protease subunit HslV
LRGTTVVAVKRGPLVALAGDGQITVGDVVMKRRASKIRTLHQGRILVGFAGAVADALALLDKFEAHLDRHQGNLVRAAVELGKEWRTDKYLRRLEAQLIVADAEHLLLLNGDGEIIEPDDGCLAIGSGGPYAQAAARALLQHTDMAPQDVAREAMTIAASLCIFTNDEITVMCLDEAPLTEQARG